MESAKEEASRTSVDMDDDMEKSSSPSPIKSEPQSPGAYEHTNGASFKNERSPTPPPHKDPLPPPKPAVDPEACKAAGNKFFKAKDYTRAIKEYTKGGIFLS